MPNDSTLNKEYPALPMEGIEIGELGDLSGTTPPREVESYGIHRFSTTTRLIVTFAMIALVTAAIFIAVQIFIAFMRGNILAPESYIGMVIAALLATIPATLLGFFSARGITVPIAKITDTVKEIQGGDYSARTGFTGYDEVGLLGSTLDEMADTIKRTTEYERQITVEVAHELRTPLMAMQANLEAMIDGVIEVDTDRLVAVNSEVLRLGRLVEAQLRLSRLEARKVEFHPRRLDLSLLITRLISNYKLLVESSGLVLDFAAEKELFIYADPDMIRQVAANLISNAIRYTPEGGRVRVLVRRVKHTAELEVADTGIGIGKEDLDVIFDKFQRAESNPKKSSGGLGIGLAIAREIVDIHKGTITVQSELGLGSSFTILLPLDK